MSSLTNLLQSASQSWWCLELLLICDTYGATACQKSIWRRARRLWRSRLISVRGKDRQYILWVDWYKKLLTYIHQVTLCDILFPQYLIKCRNISVFLMLSLSTWERNRVALWQTLAFHSQRNDSMVLISSTNLSGFSISTRASPFSANLNM